MNNQVKSYSRIFLLPSPGFVGSIEPKIVLIDGKELAELMIEYNSGVATKKAYEVKRLDTDYFDEA